MMQFATALTLLLAVVFSSGSSCEQDTVAGSNNLDRPTDLILVEDGENGDSYVVIANPRAKALRFFNITEGLFVAAPNLAFPLATITGTGTRTLHRSAENTELFFALDTVEGVTGVIDPTDLTLPVRDPALGMVFQRPLLRWEQPEHYATDSATIWRDPQWVGTLFSEDGRSLALTVLQTPMLSKEGCDRIAADTDAGVTYANFTTAVLSLSGLADDSLDGYKYRVKITSTGGTEEVISDGAATLTFGT